MEVFGGILFLTATIEGVITYLFPKSEDGVRRNYLRFVSLALGIVLAIAYQVDIPSMIGITSDTLIINYIVSGLVIGRGSNYVNDIIGSIKK